MSAFLGFLAKLLTGLFGAWIADWSRTQEAEKAGAAAEAAKVDQATSTAMQAIAEASVSAPDTVGGVVEELRKGDF